MAQEDPSSFSRFCMQVLGSLAGLQEWDCSLHTYLFWLLAVPCSTICLGLSSTFRVTVLGSFGLVSVCCDGVCVFSVG